MPAMSVRSSAVSTGPSTGAAMRLKRKDAPQIAASSTRRAVSACLMPAGSGFLFERQQLLLALEPPRVAAQPAIRPNRAVARHYQRHRVRAAGAAHRAHRRRCADRARDFLVSARLAARDAAQLVPHAALEHRTADVERQARETGFPADERQDLALQ